METAQLRLSEIRDDNFNQMVSLSNTFSKMFVCRGYKIKVTEFG